MSSVASAAEHADPNNLHDAGVEDTYVSAHEDDHGAGEERSNAGEVHDGAAEGAGDGGDDHMKKYYQSKQFQMAHVRLRDAARRARSRLGGQSESPSRQDQPSPSNASSKEHRRKHNSRLESEVAELKSRNQMLEYRAQQLDDENNRLKHQVTTMKQEIKKHLTDIFELTASKTHYMHQVDDLMIEKEELSHQILSAQTMEKQKIQELQLKIVDLQTTVERAEADAVKKEAFVNTLLQQNERLTARKATADLQMESKGDVEVKLYCTEKAKAVLQDQYDREVALSKQKDEEIEALKAELAQVARSPIRKESRDFAIVETVPTSEDVQVVDIKHAKESFQIEREGLKALVLEGLACFEEVYNAHRVMKYTAFADVDKAMKRMVDEGAIQDPGHVSARDAHHHHVTTPKGTGKVRSPGRSAPAELTVTHRRFYATSWYCARGLDLVTAWLTTLNIFSPALANTLFNAGFTDMQAISRMTESDMQHLQITPGVRRKLLTGIEDVKKKIEVVTEETLRMLRDSYYVTDEYYLKSRNEAAERLTAKSKNAARRAVKQLAAQEEAVDAHDPNAKQIPLVMDLMLEEVQNWFADMKVAVETLESAVDRIFQSTIIPQPAKLQSEQQAAM